LISRMSSSDRASIDTTVSQMWLRDECLSGEGSRSEWLGAEMPHLSARMGLRRGPTPDSVAPANGRNPFKFGYLGCPICAGLGHLGPARGGRRLIAVLFGCWLPRGGLFRRQVGCAAYSSTTLRKTASSRSSSSGGMALRTWRSSRAPSFRPSGSIDSAIPTRLTSRPH
jgi:hypothetical protein